MQLPYSTHDDDICRLLRSGKNVITTAGNHYPEAHGDHRAALFEAACRDGHSSLFGVGVSPGFIGERLALALAGTSVELDAITIDEVFDASGMISPDFVFTVMGMGTDPTSHRPVRRPAARAVPDALLRDTGLHGRSARSRRLSVIESDHHVELATRDLELRAGVIRAGPWRRPSGAGTQWSAADAG